MDAALEPRIDMLEQRVNRLEDVVAILRDDVSEIKGLLPNLATKADVTAVVSKIDQSINGILKDALSSVPAKQVVLWTSISSITALVGLGLALMHLV